MVEHRRYERYAISVEVELSFPGMRKLTMNTRDMSDGGVFLEAKDQPLPPKGSELYLRLTGLVGGEEPPTVKVRVVRVTPDGVGLQFLTPKN